MDFLEKDIIGTSLVVKEKRRFIRKVANSEKNVLILGETGTGKDLMARKIHELSHRKNKPFIPINCANIPSDLFEAELFGYARGSFTGAYKEKLGLIEIAEKGTVFLDEIGDLSLNLQAKILRIIENKEIRRIGEIDTRTIDVRFIFATNRELQKEVRKGTFRKDLYYRISVVKFYIPPLEERKEDIPLLVNYFLERKGRENNSRKEISRGALRKLMKHNFPGNIRELENIIERACIFAEENEINENDIKFDSGLFHFRGENIITPEQIITALESSRWNKTKAAQKIGKSRRQFYRLLEKYQMTDCIRKACS